MHNRQLGSTGINLSPLGLGTVKFGRNTQVKYPDSFELPTDLQIRKLLDFAKENGINVLDTAPAYGTSEYRLGKILNKSDKDHYTICSKAGEYFENHQSRFDFSKQSIISSVENSLKNLNIDCIDILLIHSDGNDVDIINNFEVFNTLDMLKAQGKIKASGMSTKTIEGGLLTLKHSDCAMITYNNEYTLEKEIIDFAKLNNKGILIKKSLSSGHIKNNTDIKNNFEFILSQSAVSSIIVGTLSLTNLKSNIDTVKQISN